MQKLLARFYLGPFLLLMATASFQMGCTEDSSPPQVDTDAVERVKQLVAFRDDALASATGDHGVCNYQDDNLQRACCKALLGDMVSHSREMDRLESLEPSTENMYLWMKEFIRMIDAQESYCDGCSDLDAENHAGTQVCN